MIVFADQHQFFKGGKCIPTFYFADLCFSNAQKLCQLGLGLSVFFAQGKKPLTKFFFVKQRNTPLTSPIQLDYNKSKIVGRGAKHGHSV